MEIDYKFLRIRDNLDGTATVVIRFYLGETSQKREYNSEKDNFEGGDDNVTRYRRDSVLATVQVDVTYQGVTLDVDAIRDFLNEKLAQRAQQTGRNRIPEQTTEDRATEITEVTVTVL